MEGRHEARENVEASADGDSESLSSDDSGSEKSLSDVEDAIYRDENGEDATLAAGVAGAYSPGISRATTPVPTPKTSGTSTSGNSSGTNTDTNTNSSSGNGSVELRIVPGHVAASFAVIGGMVLGALSVI